MANKGVFVLAFFAAFITFTGKTGVDAGPVRTSFFLLRVLVQKLFWLLRDIYRAIIGTMFSLVVEEWKTLKSGIDYTVKTNAKLASRIVTFIANLQKFLSGVKSRVLGRWQLYLSLIAPNPSPAKPAPPPPPKTTPKK